MLGLGVWEVVLILVTALIVLGPEKLPQVARQLARLLGELRRVSDEVRRNFDEVLIEPTDVRPAGTSVPPPPPPPTPTPTPTPTSTSTSTQNPPPPGGGAFSAGPGLKDAP